MQTPSKRITDAKEVNDNVKHLVFGYIKSIQKSNESLITIPIEMFYLCILFLFEKECFEIAGKGVTISHDKLTITKKQSANDGWLNTSYGKVVIPSTSKTIATWKLKFVLKHIYAISACIGIASNTKCIAQDFSCI